MRSGPGSKLLGRYEDDAGHTRELVARPGSGGSLLVIDHDAATLGDRRMVAHLAGDEPHENAALVCELYLQDARQRWCREVAARDLEVVPFEADEHALAAQARLLDATPELLDRKGCVLSIGPVAARMSIPELRWQRHPAAGDMSPPALLSVRDVVADLESYEPVRTLTLALLARHRADPDVSVATLGAELERVDSSRLVLNRGLRQAVLTALHKQGLTMSEIAVRCGRVKRDRRGHTSGETSWLARRVGILPPGGEHTPTPWVHSDVLALIARHGLGICPREVELG
ncbi:MAG TPA: hypothetical protein VLJ42_07190 [Solirubrobacteraceae bacterium]|nr:hypothetical protein [Solirubrobacteraceae bacterium]